MNEQDDARYRFVAFLSGMNTVEICSVYFQAWTTIILGNTLLWAGLIIFFFVGNVYLQIAVKTEGRYWQSSDDSDPSTNRRVQLSQVSITVLNLIGTISLICIICYQVSERKSHLQHLYQMAQNNYYAMNQNMISSDAA